MIHWGTCVSLIVLLCANGRRGTTKKNIFQLKHKLSKVKNSLSRELGWQKEK